MNSTRTIMRLVAVLLGLILPLILVGSTLSLGHAQGPEEDAYLVKDIDPLSSSQPFGLTDVNDTLFFTTIYYDGELWKSDGTEAGTVRVKDINPGSGPSHPRELTDVNGTLFFWADDGTHGYELWKSDGTEAGTVMIRDINPGSGPSYPGFTGSKIAVNVNGTLFFQADNGTHGRELWKSDGTGAGTVMVKDINTSGDSEPRELTHLDGTLFFNGDEELWKSDGTEAGTVNINPTGLSDPRLLTPVDDILFFVAYHGMYGGWELWKSDGTEAGTVLVKDINPLGDSISYTDAWLVAVNDTLYFVADDGSTGEELWKSDGTEAGTVLVKDILPRTDTSDPYHLTALHGMLYFSAYDGASAHGTELWKSDGTEEGTVLVRDIRPGAVGSGPIHLAAMNDVLYFSARDDDHGRELWKSDGTEAGTVLVTDIYPGSGDSYPGYLTAVDGALFFEAGDGTHGRELWALSTLVPQIITVDIDIKPGSDPNSINCNNQKGVIAVAILTTEDFDAMSVDHTTVTFEGASETHVDKKSGEPRRHEEDVDYDGDMDLVFHFRLGDTVLTCDSTDGTLIGQTFDGQAIEGSGSVRMIDRGGGPPFISPVAP